MKKDYLLASSTQAQLDFMADFWDQRWRDKGLDTDRQHRLRRTEEYRFLRRLLPQLERDGMDILDCGCGRGEWTLLFQAQGHRAMGIDIAEDTVRRLHDQHGEMFRWGDFRKIDCPENSFDLVINWGGIEHFEEGPTGAIQEAYRVLRPGGCYVVTTPCHNLRLFLLDALLRHTTGPDYPLTRYRFYQYRFTPAELEGYFRACGFQSIHSRIIGGAQGVHRSLQHELGWLGNRLPYLIRGGLMWAGGRLLRPVLGHMVICAGTK